jgi:UPF0755 protein
MKWKPPIYYLIALVTIFLIIYFGYLDSPANFPTNSIYTINKGVGLNMLASDLQKSSIIKSPFWFKSFSVLFGGSKGILAGDYVLNKKQAAIGIAYRFSRGDFRLDHIKITFPEGLNVFEIAKLVAQKFPTISEKTFIELARAHEGYLFPDTYFFLPNVTAQEIIDGMKSNFQIRIKTLEGKTKNSDKSLADIIKMASILETEARTVEARRTIAGILWKRIALGMPLQVDVSFKYINGKVTRDLSLADLKIDSPYNSYLYKGLPPTPISNPGLESIQAALDPIITDYLYFLSDNSGNMYYAKDYDTHLHNKELYLK